MQCLFLIDGAAGTGKSDLLDYIREKYEKSGTAVVLPKYTTRSHRQEEIERRVALDLRFVTRRKYERIVGSEVCYSYDYGGAQYAFTKSTLDAALGSGRHVFAIVRSLQVIQRLRIDYRKYKTVAVYVYTDTDKIRSRLCEDGYAEADIAFRLGRQGLVWDDYLRNSRGYDDVLVNNSNRTDFRRLIDQLIQRHSNEEVGEIFISPDERFRLPRALVGFKDEIVGRLETYPYERNVFLMMKYRPSNRLIYQFIKREVESRGYRCVRADEQEWNISRNVYNPLAVMFCCKYGIALFDEPEPGAVYNPNVAYELGVMHLQRKTVLILRHAALPQVPFDLIKDLHVTYADNLEVEDHVRSWLASVGERAQS